MKTEKAACWFLVLAVVVALGACATAGKKFDRAHINDIQKGVQSREQIQEWFGKPYQVAKPLQENPAGCVERWTFVHAYASFGGTKTTSAALVVDFDKAGRVCDHAYTESSN